jgi:acyl-CoA-binding protein
MKGMDKNTLVVEFLAVATPEQRASAQAILDAFDPVQEQAAIEAEEADERDRQAFLKLIREKYAALQADLDTARNAFLTLKGRYDKLETWAKTKGYVP